MNNEENTEETAEERAVVDAMPVLSFDQIKDAEDLETRKVPVKEWGGAVLLKTMTGDVRDEYVQLVQNRMVGSGKGRKISNYKGLSSSLIQKCAVKADGTQLFTPVQVREIQKKSSAILQRLLDICQEMNGLSDDEVEKYSGNFETTQNADDGTTLPTGEDAPSGSCNES